MPSCKGGKEMQSVFQVTMCQLKWRVLLTWKMEQTETGRQLAASHSRRPLHLSATAMNSDYKGKLIIPYPPALIFPKISEIIKRKKKLFFSQITLTVKDLIRESWFLPIISLCHFNKHLA